jgi:hypothetical protein
MMATEPISQRTRLVIALTLLTGLNIFLAFNKHSHGPKFTYHGELWADKGGYFVYLPAVFEHGFRAAAFPAGLDTVTGNGFTLNARNGILRTKYTSGVAILLSPVYLAAHAIGSVAKSDVSTFGDVDHAVVDIAAGLYLSIGLACLYLLLRVKFSSGTALFVLAGVFLGSNLFFYTIGDPGMSHVYSFSLFCVFLFLVVNRPTHGPFVNTLLLGAIAGLILLIRPTNLIFLVFAPLVAAWVNGSSLHSVIRSIGYRDLALLIGTTSLVWIPQLWYWHLSFGSAFTWPYQGESFTNLGSPELMKFWLSPNNGLFLYAPIVLIALGGSLVAWQQGGRLLAIASISCFALVSYLGASWWVWHFGCGFGSRTMTEYMAVFAFPLGVWVEKQRNGPMAKVLRTLIVVCAVAVVKMVYSYGDCWFHGDWNWAEYCELVFGPTK